MTQLSERIKRLSPSDTELLTELLRNASTKKVGASTDDATQSPTTLAAFVTLESDCDVGSIEQEMRKRLPAYMQPRYIRRLDTLPKTQNGKVDKRSLSRNTHLASPTKHRANTSDNKVESAILSIFKSRLGLDTISPTDDFFKIGGDSILAIGVVSEMRRQGFDTSVSDLFKNPTPFKLAALIADSSTSENPVPSQSPEASSDFLKIWRSVLSAPDFGSNDDFFQSGGDSILAISLVSALRKHNYDVSVSQVFQHPSPFKLQSALRVPSEKVNQPEPSTPTPPHQVQLQTRDADVPFTPIQNWFFEQKLANPNHWNQSILLELSPDASFEKVRTSFARLYENNPALRLKFESQPTRILQRVVPFEEITLPVDKYLIPSWQERREQRKIEAKANALHSSMRLNEGCLLRGSFFEYETNQQPPKLLLVAHHLCVDAVSWNFIIEELTSQKVASPNANYNFVDWANSLTAYTRSKKCIETAPEWIQLCDQPSAKIPFDKGYIEQNLEGSSTTIDLDLDPSQTAALQRVATANEGGLQAIFLAAVSRVLADAYSTNRLLLGVEGHGREALADGQDPSHSIGWFTSYFPLALDLRASDNLFDTLKETASKLGSTPDRGLSFGVLRYLTDGLDKETQERLSELRPEVIVNYLGKQETPQNSKMLAFGVGRDRDPSNRRDSIFEINAFVRDERLIARWTFSHALHLRETVTKLVGQLRECLESFAQLAPISSDGEENRRPLNDGQNDLLLHRIARESNDQGELCIRADIEGDLTIERAEEAWLKLVETHPALRARIAGDRTANPSIVEHATSPSPTVTHDLSQMPERERTRCIEDLETKARSTATQLTSVPNHQLHILRHHATRHSLIWRCHHLFLDGWSGSLLLQQFCDLIAGKSPPTKVANTASNQYYRWLNRQRPSLHDAFWKDRLAEASPTSLPPTVRPSEANQAHQGQRKAALKILGPQAFEQLRQTAADLGVTSSALIVAAWGTTLSRLVQSENVCFGLAQSGRNLPIADAETIIGCLANVVPVTFTSAPSEQREPWLRDLAERIEEISRYTHLRVPKMGSRSGVSLPLFNTAIAISNFPSIEGNTSYRISNYKGDSTSTVSLLLGVELDSRFKLTADYDCSTQSAEAVDSLMEAFALTLTQISKEGRLVSPDGLERFAQQFRESTASCAVPKSVKQEEPVAVNRPPSDGKASLQQSLLAELHKAVDDDSAQLDDNIFELGLSSLKAIQFLNAIESITGKRLNLSALITHPNVSQLATLLDNGAKTDQPYKNLVEIQSGANGPALFLVHAGGLELMFYKSLADHLDPSLPIYGLEAVGLDGRERPSDDLPSIAKRYRQEIQRKQPHGPYFILGHCFGATIAVEIARQLTELNYDVPLIFSVDGPAHQIKSNFDDPVQRPDVVRRIYHSVLRFKQSCRDELRIRFAKPDERREAIYLRVKRAFITATRNYFAPPYSGDMIHFKCIDSEGYYNHSELAWHSAVPNVEIIHSPAPHDQILEEPYVGDVARTVTDALNARHYENRLQARRTVRKLRSLE